MQIKKSYIRYWCLLLCVISVLPTSAKTARYTIALPLPNQVYSSAKQTCHELVVAFFNNLKNQYSSNVKVNLMKYPKTGEPTNDLKNIHYVIYDKYAANENGDVYCYFMIAAVVNNAITMKVPFYTTEPILVQQSREAMEAKIKGQQNAFEQLLKDGFTPINLFISDIDAITGNKLKVRQALVECLQKDKYISSHLKPVTDKQESRRIVGGIEKTTRKVQIDLLWDNKPVPIRKLLPGQVTLLSTDIELIISKLKEKISE